MKRKLISLILILAVCLSVLSLTASAEDHPSRVVDKADLLSNYEERALAEKLDEISLRQQLDVAVVTVDTLDGKTPREFADDYFDYNGYGMGAGDDGILLLISMEDRDWYITTHGYGITAFTDAGIDYIGEQIVPDLGDGNYTAAFETFANLCDRFVAQAKSGEPFDYSNMPKEPFHAAKMVGIALVIGLVVAIIVISVLQAQLKSVKAQSGAAAYAVRGSMQVTDAGEMFLYRNIHRVKRETSSGGSSTHRSSSGRSHGGGGGKF